jgi:arginine deiminase
MFLKSDTSPLLRVITLTPGEELHHVITWAAADHPVLAGDYIQEEAIEEHKEFVKILRNHGVEVLDVVELLNSAIRCVSKASFQNWLEEQFAEKSRFLVNQIERVDGEALIGRREEFFFTEDEGGNFDPIIQPHRAMFYTRDFSVMTPRGLIICNFVHFDRSIETPLIRFIFQYAPELRRYGKWVFDAEEKDVLLQGGDVAVLDEETLLIGVNNVTELEAAKQIAIALNIDVITVDLPISNVREVGLGSWLEINQQLVHLDTIFSFVDEGKALSIPYILEEKYTEDNPLYRVFRGLHKQLSAIVPKLKYKESSWFTQTLANNIVTLKKLGWVSRVKRGTGEVEPLGVKLVDYLRDLGYEIIYVCGKEEGNEFKRVFSILRELRFQAANVLTLQPGKVIAYGDNERTIEELRRHGVDVIPLRGKALLRWCGGPHCMSMPLERGERTC